MPKKRSGSRKKRSRRDTAEHGKARRSPASDETKYLPEDLEPGEKELLLAWGDFIEEHFPNPQRKDCPGDLVLKKIATAPKKFHDRNVLDHIARCAPCSKEMRELLYRAKHGKK